MNYNTDKIYKHGFNKYYESFFAKKKDASQILEIGVACGGSLKYLADQFPDSQIHGIDIIDTSRFNTDRITTHIGNQGIVDDLENIINDIGSHVNFDIILDDGGHCMHHQQISLGVLFPLLKPGGFYILEDLHTSRFPAYNAFKGPDDLITTLDMLETLKHTKKVISSYMSDEAISYIQSNTKDVNIWSKTIDFNESVTSVIEKTS